MELDQQYSERVYAGVLGKIIGVYLGRPFEGWEHGRIERELGEITGYVHDRLGQPLIVTDDDISGTFTFLRALEDHGPSLTAKEIGETWLNYIIENRAILWWGGMGMSTEHTAFLRLKNGVPAPLSGSININGRTVAEQIGAQIFIDGWGLVCPGDPEKATHFARLAASVSHDGEAIYGAQIVAAMVAAAFDASFSPTDLVETALTYIPNDCLIRRLIDALRDWHASGETWREGFRRIQASYGYDKYGGNCHIVPNHALIIHALLHGNGDFAESLKIVNTCGWDTDCNSGNVGCILGVLNGLDRIPAHFRDPVRDRLYLPTADGGRCITDAVAETEKIVSYARVIRHWPQQRAKPRFHFSLPGSVQGFSHGVNFGGRLIFTGRTSTATYSPVEARAMPGYSLLASPTLYSGQVIRGRLSTGSARVFVGVERCAGLIEHVESTEVCGEFEWQVPDTTGSVICEVGLRSDDEVHLDWLTWDGEPTQIFNAREGWVNGVSDWLTWGSAFRLVQNEGTGLVITGTREWKDYRVTATVRPNLAERAGIAARVQGMKRWIGLLRTRSGTVQLVKNDQLILAESAVDWPLGEQRMLCLEVVGSHVRGYVDGQLVADFVDEREPLTCGGIAFVLEEGRIDADEIRVEPMG